MAQVRIRIANADPDPRKSEQCGSVRIRSTDNRRRKPARRKSDSLKNRRGKKEHTAVETGN